VFVRFQDGRNYKLYYNASCPLSLSHATSVISHVMQDITSTSSPVTPAAAGYRLAEKVSAWLQPWPPVTQEEEWGALHWVPVLFLGLALLVTPCSYAARMLTERQVSVPSGSVCW
jgi:hypothetical protein